MKYYIASGLENFAKVQELRDFLNFQGWKHTYDWSIHGAVDVERLQEISQLELAGINQADVLIVLLPGGRGTHVELGMGLAYADACKDPALRIVVFSEDPEKFGTKGVTCAFYHHPCVERFTSMDEMIASLLKKD